MQSSLLSNVFMFCLCRHFSRGRIGHSSHLQCNMSGRLDGRCSHKLDDDAARGWMEPTDAGAINDNYR